MNSAASLIDDLRYSIDIKTMPMEEASDPLLHEKEAVQTAASPILAVSADQDSCKARKRAQRHFTHWSIVEDLALLQAIRKLGRAWRQISKETPELINRQPDSCRKRFDAIWAKQISLAELQDSKGDMLIERNGRLRRLIILNSEEPSDSCEAEAPIAQSVEPRPLYSPIPFTGMDTEIHTEELGGLNLFDPVDSLEIDTSDPLYQQILASLNARF